ncbi:MAG: class I SAM-dependent methyltransferase, partial [Gammaproteobacteria bacterium]
DMVILPHVLEFNQNYLQVLREAERVLKPEGKLIVLGFNPWSRFSLYQSIVRDQKKAPCRGNFISRLRLIDRLSMLNFEAEVAAGFNIKTVASNSSDYEKSKRALTVTAYAVKAVKRRFNIIPLRPAVEEKPRLAVAGAVESSGWLKHG